MSPNSLAEQMYLSQALKQNPLRIDPLYLSFRPGLLSSIAKAFEPFITSLHCDFLYPIDSSSIPLATHLSLLYDIPLFLSTTLDPFIRSGQTALLLSVTPSFAPKLQEALDALKKQDIGIESLLLLLDAENEEKQLCQKQGIPLHNLWDIKTLQTDLNALLHQNSYSKIH